MTGGAELGLAVGELIDGRYRVVAELGAGAMGKVYRVVHVGIDKEMALKLLRPELSALPNLEERFNQEARSAARLDDPHIVRITDFGRSASGALFMVMELLEGQRLSELAAEGPLELPAVLELAEQLLRALEHAHGAGVIHRDLKPDNLMLVARGEARTLKILDFGLAKLLQPAPAAPTLTQAGMVFGTPRYMAPEQATAGVVDARADLYAVGVILYELLAGRPLFRGETAVEVMTQQVVATPEPLELRPVAGYDLGALSAAIFTALEKAPDARHPSARAFREALAAARTEGRAPIAARRRRVSLPTALSIVTALSCGLALLAGRRAVEDPLAGALAAGDLATAARLARSALDANPEDVSAQLALAHVALSRDDRAEAILRHEAALAIDGAAAGHELLQRDVRAMIDRRELDPLLATIARRAPEPAAPFLAELAEKARRPASRRLAYEGLERLGRTELLDRFGYLSAQLAGNSTEVCAIRRWYLERLIALEDRSVLPILIAESERRSGPLGLPIHRTAACMDDLLPPAIARLRAD